MKLLSYYHPETSRRACLDLFRSRIKTTSDTMKAQNYRKQETCTVVQLLRVCFIFFVSYKNAIYLYLYFGSISLNKGTLSENSAQFANIYP